MVLALQETDVVTNSKLDIVRLFLFLLCYLNALIIYLVLPPLGNTVQVQPLHLHIVCHFVFLFTFALSVTGWNGAALVDILEVVLNRIDFLVVSLLLLACVTKDTAQLVDLLH